MAYHFNDNVHTKSFTPKEPNIELLDSATEQNIIVCLCNSSGKSFVANKLIQHVYNSSNLKPGIIALYVADSPHVVGKQAGYLRRLTNLTVVEFDNTIVCRKKCEWKESLKDKVLVMTTQFAVVLLKENHITMSDINLLILHGCHCILRSESALMKQLMNYYFESPVKPHLLGLANSLFVSDVKTNQMEAEINRMEELLNCKAETASSVVSVLRYNARPHEAVLECGEREKCSLDELVENEIFSAIDFLNDHQFNPNEIYGGYMDELDIPDPTCEPREILTELLEIYHTLGPWSADRAAVVFLVHIEKLKIATPYERHFLLLCMIFSSVLKIRAILSDFFENVSDRDRIYKYTSPKILRLIEVLKKFQPEKNQSEFDDTSESDDDIMAVDNNTDTTKDININSHNDCDLTKNGECTLNDNDRIITSGLDKEIDVLISGPNSYSNGVVQTISESVLPLMEKPECNGLNFRDTETESDNLTNKTVIKSDCEINDKPIIIHCENSHEEETSVCSSELEQLDINEIGNEIKDNENLLNGDSAVINKSLENNYCTVDQPSNASCEDLVKSVDTLQKMNGFLQCEQNEVASKGRVKQTLRNRNKKDYMNNKTNSLDDFLPCQEYLLLPKFKVDKLSRFERNPGFSHSKAIGQDDFLYRQIKNFGDADLHQLCALIFVEKKFTAKVLFQLLNDLKQCDNDFSFLSVQFTIGKLLDGNKDPKGAETEHRKQELVLKKFRTRECNVLIGTSLLEEGIDLPKCNLVIRFNVPRNYRSYVCSKERARATDSLFCLLINEGEREDFIHKLAEYFETERILLKKCMNHGPKDEEEKEADQYVQLIQPFCPLEKRNSAYVDLSTAIAHVNRYCTKLPSDTFTCLTPLWNVKSVQLYDREMFVCSIRLPINSPVKQEIRPSTSFFYLCPNPVPRKMNYNHVVSDFLVVVKGCPMPTSVLARRFAAFQCCQLLHFEGEIDDSLQPISKESFWIREEEQLTSGSEEFELIPKDSTEPRPGTTKRRQYYYKRIADSLTDCRPVSGKKSFLYDISMALTYPLPEEQNTRGRKIHAPEDSLQGFGILTGKTIPQLGAFPIFTRSGEVQVNLQLAQTDVMLSESQVEKIVDFIHYTFTSVLRLQRYLMMFDPSASENSYFIVPTKREKNSVSVEVDWEFLELIYKKKNHKPTFIPNEMRRNFIFDPKMFEDAVITPWYRNQDQPQYFYVAEICYNLSPKSSFPGTEYDTFEEYYLKKYDIQIQNSAQALLDVDHTSARLNFLTPRYVNRKGVALPTTSEEKKRAKRENLEQKQILVPELCNIHPFPGTLWRKAVCLPCILHRINSLLLADQVRRVVANEIGVGIAELDANFKWKPLDFGWSLSDVLTQSRAMQQNREEEEKETEPNTDMQLVPISEINKKDESNTVVDIEELDEKIRDPSWMEIGTWSNDMAVDHHHRNSYSDGSDITEPDLALPQNVTMIDEGNLNETTNNWRNSSPSELVRYGSPTGWDHSKLMDDDMSDIFCDSCSDDYLSETRSSDSDSGCGGLRIEFKEDNVAEAVEKDGKDSISNIEALEEEGEEEPWLSENSVDDEKYSWFKKEFEKKVMENKNTINEKILYKKDVEFDFVRYCKSSKFEQSSESENDLPFGNSDNTFPQLIENIPETLTDLPLTEVIIRAMEDEKVRKSNRHESKLVDSIKERSTEFDDETCTNFSFDEQPDLNNHPGPSPSLILQALTMSNANDGINLERLETIGDSFLKYAITAYLYCTYENVHEGKLSHLRSKQVSNYSLYRLGYKKVLGESMIATKFEPHDNWLPPCYYIPRALERALIKTGLPASHWNRADLPALRNLTDEEIRQLVKEKGEQLGIVNSETGVAQGTLPVLNLENMPCFIPYNLMTQHSIPDKSIADCVEALIGAYLVACGPRGALLFMSWLGIKVLPKEENFFKTEEEIPKHRLAGTTLPFKMTTESEDVWCQITYGDLKAPKPPLLRHVPDPEGELERLLRGFDTFEENIRYRFRDRSYLLQALTHASYSWNRLTDCYQRLEFLGDAVLDYLITRHLYEDPRHHSPGALTDLRSALVNNTIFASLAVRHNFHRYFRHLCPGLNEVVDRFVRIQEENGHSINEEFYLIEEEECEEVEDVEVPKALGDIFESIAGAIFLDSGMSLDAVWRVYYRIMKKEIELFSKNVPKSPIRELFELEPETAQFGKPEKLADGKRVRVTVEVFGKGLFNGIGRNYRIAKCTAAKCALKKLKSRGLLDKGK